MFDNLDQEEADVHVYDALKGVPSYVVNQNAVMLTYLVVKAGGRLELPSGEEMVATLREANVGQISKEEDAEGKVVLVAEPTGYGHSGRSN